MLVREGLDGFSMQRLARAAGVSPATLYIYFKDRDDLLFQLYKVEMEKMAEVTLKAFDPELPFADGLRVQWRNRAQYCLAHPLEAEFLEHVRHSPYHQRFLPRLDPEFIEKMGLFVKNAIRRKEMLPVPKEVFWALAYAPLYQLLKFKLSGRSLGGQPYASGETKFALDDGTMELALTLVIKALTP